VNRGKDLTRTEGDCSILVPSICPETTDPIHDILYLGAEISIELGGEQEEHTIVYQLLVSSGRISQTEIPVRRHSF